jgi:hypothetical protein
MMEKLMDRAEKIGRAAAASRLQQIATELGESGMKVESDSQSVALGGRGLAHRWLSEPLLRFISARLA